MLPAHMEIKRLLEYKIKSYDENFTIPKDVIKAADGLSHAEIARVCDDAIKNSILNDESITDKIIISLLNERHNVYSCKEA